MTSISIQMVTKENFKDIFKLDFSPENLKEGFKVNADNLLEQKAFKSHGYEDFEDNIDRALSNQWDFDDIGMGFKDDWYFHFPNYYKTNGWDEELFQDELIINNVEEFIETQIWREFKKTVYEMIETYKDFDFD